MRALTDTTYLRELPRLLRLVASRTSGELNVTDVARDLGLARATTDSYLAHLEAVFLVHTVPAWSTNLTSRVVRRPKIGLTDTGLAARLLGGRLRSDAHPEGCSNSVSVTDFAAGIVLCTGPAPVHLGGRLRTLPISALWCDGSITADRSDRGGP